MADVKLCDVTMRDGMQVLNRRNVIPMELRLQLFDALQRAHLPYLEVGSFVSPRVIPAMADTAELIAAIRPVGAEIAVLVPKLAYFRQLVENDPQRKVTKVALFLSASQAYSEANTRMNKERAFDSARQVAEAARAEGYGLRGYLSCSFRDLGPNSPPMDPEIVRSDCELLLEMGCDTVSLSDTDGRATPQDVRRVVAPVAATIGLTHIGVHLHDRYGQGIANALVAHQEGVRIFDCSVGGIGGTRAVKHSVGNIATEELVALLEGAGVDTGIDRESLIDAGKIIIEMSRLVGDPLPPSKLLSHRLLKKDASGYLTVPEAAHIAVSTLRDRKVTRQSRNWAALLVAVARTPIGTAAIASMLTFLLVLLTGLLLTQVFSIFSIVRSSQQTDGRAISVQQSIAGSPGPLVSG